MNPILIATTNCRSNFPTIRLAAIAAGASLLLIASVSSSCSTTKGFGKDVEKTGDKIQEAATRASN